MRPYSITGNELISDIEKFIKEILLLSFSREMLMFFVGFVLDDSLLLLLRVSKGGASVMLG